MRGLRRLWRGLVALAWCAALGWGGWWLLTDPESPLPRAWNPLEPLDVTDVVTPLTRYKLDRAARAPETCFAALRGNAAFTRLDPLRESEDCYIDPRVRLTGVGGVALRPVETTCEVALRLAMWERHGLRAAAASHLGTEVTEIRHASSYACRAIRTMAGDGARKSTHATAQAIDVRGFTTRDGRQLDLVRDWDGEAAAAGFVRSARDTACDWFGTTLGPDYNALHADHFHLQSRGWGLCR